MAVETPTETIARYLQDAVAAEKNFETQLRAMAKEGAQPEVQAVFRQHAEETRRQWERLEARLNALGGSASTLKSFFAHLATFVPKVAQLGHEAEEKNTQDLMMAYSVENSEVAMYEALAVTAAAAGDRETEMLAREIQREEQATADKIFKLIEPSAVDAFDKVTGGGATGVRPTAY